ncbi:hypothetical protein PORCRE_1497 [Porphyromonas crevioricanis JCM 15906]|uniref:Uncharacterized protein n=1 Tax=Porphyromonas crevioricanis JCM 15906 TaxID=1305617 RepID=T1DTG0_9PORP|nr:hypothetical protein PORCRE_1497 [Porphyromonas crevioricanis JCM 15906]
MRKKIFFRAHSDKFSCGTIRGKGIGEPIEGKWMRMRGIFGVLRWFALECKEQKMWIYAEVPLPNH